MINNSMKEFKSPYTDIPEVDRCKSLLKPFTIAWWESIPFSLRAVFVTNVIYKDIIVHEDDEILPRYLRLYHKIYNAYREKGGFLFTKSSFELELEKMKNLETFVMLNSKATSDELGFISELKNLKKLALVNFCNLENLDFIKPLKKIEFLNVSIFSDLFKCQKENSLIDLSALEELKLKSLILDKRLFKSLDFVNKIKGLVELSAKYCEIEYIDFLSDVLLLEKIDLERNKISSLKPLQHHTHIKNLNLFLNKIDSIEPILRNINMDNLNLGSNYIIKCHDLSVFKQLSKFNINNNMIDSLDFISDNKKLVCLNAGYNKINSIDDIKDLINLEDIFLSNNNLSAIKILKYFTKLSCISINNNFITDFSSLDDLNELELLKFSVSVTEFDNHLGDRFSRVKHLINIPNEQFDPNRRKKEIIEEKMSYLESKMTL